MLDLSRLKKETRSCLTDMESAVRWWNRLSDSDRNSYVIQYFPELIEYTLSYESIYWIWQRKQ
jgi:hypothetical protein